MSERPRLIVHGGAGDIPDSLLDPFRAGCRRALEVGYGILNAGGSAEDAVEAAICVMEDDETFDAGKGSHLNQDGFVSMDAGFMEGAGLNVGAVAGLRDIPNPITVARRIMESEHTFLIGEGAAQFAVAHGISRCDPQGLIVPRERDEWLAMRQALRLNVPYGDTVGAIARDAKGHLAAGVSTGGRKFAVPGRVGDVPCVGSGFYADDAVGAAVSTGEGEYIVRIVMAKRAVDHLAAGMHPQQAAEEVIAYLAQRVGGRAGIIVMDREGRIGCAYNTFRMGRAWREDGHLIVRVNRED
ncbi:MAG: isoaspartyl peptidase/L-asparaginase [Chloroflexi bacterium]|nr:isoaspartyl peptidase/L-asparaginase [Chloroflexota bacterium]